MPPAGGTINVLTGKGIRRRRGPATGLPGPTRGDWGTAAEARPARLESRPSRHQAGALEAAPTAGSRLQVAWAHAHCKRPNGRDARRGSSKQINQQLPNFLPMDSGASRQSKSSQKMPMR